MAEKDKDLSTYQAYNPKKIYYFVVIKCFGKTIN